MSHGDATYASRGEGKIFLQNQFCTMAVIVILLLASISVAGLFLAAFLWSVKSGQFEDDFSPSSRILFDNDTQSSTQS